MADDALIAGAAAPTRKRWITAPSRLDAVWVLVVGAALGVSSRFDLIDLPTARLRTGDAPLRAFVVGLPLVACSAAVLAAWRRSVAIAAAATGFLAPGIALSGSLSASLFLDEASAFADVGVAISLGAALIGAAMLLRWVVYHPLSLVGDEARPLRASSLGLSAVGLAMVALVVFGGRGDAFGVAWIGETAAMVVVPVLLIAGGLIRTVPAVVLAAASAIAQIIAVLIVKVEEPAVPWDSNFVLRTGVVGCAVLAVATVLAIISILGSAPDDVPAVTEDDEPWRWSADG